MRLPDRLRGLDPLTDEEFAGLLRNAEHGISVNGAYWRMLAHMAQLRTTIPLARVSVYHQVDEERDRQDPGTQYPYSAPHILLLEEKVARLRAGWYDDTGKVKEDLVKVAAIAVRALEEIKVVV